MEFTALDFARHRRWELLNRDPAALSGNAVHDEEILREVDVEDFSKYNVTDGDPMPLSAQMFDPEFERPAE